MANSAAPVAGALDRAAELGHVLATLAIDSVTLPYVARPADRRGLGAVGHFCRHLLLRDRRARLFLVLADEHRDRVDLKALRKVVGACRSLSFAAADEVEATLCQRQGGVSLFGLLSRPAGVSVVVDSKLVATGDELFNLHPFDEEFATQLRWADVATFVRFCGFEVQLVDVPYV